MTADEQIKAHILDELRWDPKVEAAEIGVIVKDGAVTLTGTVSSFPAKRAAEQASKRVKGVRAIAEKIQVKLLRGKSISDDEIAKRIAHVLDWSLSIPDHNIIAEVSEGHVILTGDVDWQHQRTKAASLIEEVRGVVDVTNDIKIRPRATDADVKHAIVSALHRHATIEAAKIEVAIVDGKVTLRGDVDSAMFANDITRNTYVWGAILLCLGVIAAALWLPGLAGLLRLPSPGGEGLVLAALFSFAPLLLGQVVLLALRSSSREGGQQQW